MKKIFYSSVAVITITWALGLTALVPVTQAVTLNSGDLIKASSPSVYYYGENGKRYVFPDLKTYQTWYGDDFSAVKQITDAELASITIGGNTTYRPGIKMVKILSDPKVYAVDKNGTLRWIKTEEIAICVFGSNWGALVNDLSDAFFTNYTVGAELANCSDYDKTAIMASTPTINHDKLLLPAHTDIIQCSTMDCLIDLAQTCQPGEVEYNYVGPIPLLQIDELIFDVTTYYKIEGKNNDGLCTLTEKTNGGTTSITAEDRQNLIADGITDAEIDEIIQLMNEALNSEDVLNTTYTCTGTSANMSVYLTNEKNGTTSLSCEIDAEQTSCVYEPDITCVSNN